MNKPSSDPLGAPSKARQDPTESSALDENTNLPYSFDLLYDIKTLGELHGHLTGKRRTATSATDAELLELMREHNIALPPGYEVDSNSLHARYEQAIALLQLLNEHARPAHDMVLDSGYIESQTRELLMQHGRYKAFRR